MSDSSSIKDSSRIEKIYASGQLQDKLAGVLKKMGADVNKLSPGDLAMIEDLHLRGREGTKELIELLDLKDGCSLADLGCGIGGTCRFIAAAYKCNVTGIDLSEEFCSTAAFLTERAGLSDYISYLRSDVTDLPFEEGIFDFAVSLHVQMNIRDKAKFLSEAYRILKPGGAFAFFDIFTAGKAPVYYPVPWANKADISFLETWQNYKSLLEKAGFREKFEKDVSDATRSWFRMIFEKTRERGEFPEHSRIIIGENAEERMRNVSRSLDEGLIELIQGVVVKP